MRLVLPKITAKTVFQVLITTIAKMAASGTQERKERPYFQVPFDWMNHVIIEDTQAVFVPDQVPINHKFRLDVFVFYDRKMAISPKLNISQITKDMKKIEKMLKIL